jgi:C4-dicarboxylate transporter DctM subunit
MTLLAILLPVLLLGMGAPVFLVLLTGAAFVFVFIQPIRPVALHQVFFGGLDNYALLAVPFFVLAGQLMGRSGIADRLIAWVLALVGRVPGSLGVAAVGGSTVMGAVSGSSVAAVAALGRTLHPQLERAGYGRARAAGLIASAGAIDIVIPPSIAMILYGLAAEQSIARLFVGGILPGLVMAAMMAGFIVATAIWLRLPVTGRFELAEVARTSRAAAAALMMPVVVLGGIYSGLFSPTEAGGVACLYAMLVARYLYRSMSWAEIVATAGDAALLSARILVIVAAAGLVTWVLTTRGVPQAMVAWIAALEVGPVSFLLAVNAALLVVGCLLDPSSAILVLAPLLVPVAVSLGVDPIHFGVVMTVNLAIGMFTPPFGLNLFVAQQVTGVGVTELYRGVLPFVLVMIAALAVITYVPALSLALWRPI